MRTTRSLAATCVTLSMAALGAARAQAEEATPNTVRLGLYAIFYRAKADDLSGPYVPPGVNIDVKDVQTLYLAYVRRFATHFDLELAIGWPPDTKTIGKGPARLGSVPYNGQEISSARWFAPTLLLNYVFFDETHALRPYAGIGINYTTFYSRRSTAAGNAASGGPTRISLTSSVGPSATVGLSYRLSDRWGLYASYSITRVRTHLTADTAGAIRTTTISFGPQALVVSAGYSF
jgi:outer membrane protein